MSLTQKHAAEDQRTSGDGDVGERVVSRGIEFQGKDRREASKNVKVISLDHRPDRGGENHFPDLDIPGPEDFPDAPHSDPFHSASGKL